jgi:hypothetical protein
MALTFENRIQNLETQPRIASGASLTLNAVQHAGRVILLNQAAGEAITLPAATGTGNKYFLFKSVSLSSNTTTIKVANATDVMAGQANVAATASGTFPTTSTSDTITFNATTQGGLLGSFVEIEDIASGVFRVLAHIVGSGTAVTVFSATV